MMLTPKKSVRLALQSSQRRERIDPFTGIGRTGQATFFVPRRHREGQENLILHQLGHVQFLRHGQEIPGIVFQLILRQVGTFGNQFQQAIDIQFKRHGIEATLAGEGDNPGNTYLQQRLTSPTFATLDAEGNLTLNNRQQIMQAFEPRDRQAPFENLTVSGKYKGVRNPFQFELLRLKREMILFLAFQVKTKVLLQQ